MHVAGNCDPFLIFRCQSTAARKIVVVYIFHELLRIAWPVDQAMVLVTLELRLMLYCMLKSSLSVEGPKNDMPRAALHQSLC